MGINRRQALGALSAGAALAPLSKARAQGEVVFAYGVAAGDPTRDGLLIWTHARSADGKAVALRWQVATDRLFKKLAWQGRATARPERDFTVKLPITGLKPGVTYFYRFFAGEVISAVGQARTLPVGATDKLVLVSACCAMYAGGYFNAYKAIAKLPRVDAVIHLGDYIYEVAGEKPADYGYDTGSALGRLPQPRHACLTLADYRARFAQTRRDPACQAAHARAAWICCWDDHDLANDDWTDGAQAHNSVTDGPFSARKWAAVQAFYEWMPIRDPRAGQAFEAINRSFDFGDLASFTLLETRLTARDQQLTYGADLPKSPDGTPDVAAFQAKLKAPARRMMSPDQERWLGEVLGASVAGGKPWQIVGSGVTCARVSPPDLKSLMGDQAYADMTAQVQGYYKIALADHDAKTRFDLPFGLDSWDGYPAARERFYAAIRSAKARTVVLSGDSHLAWVNDLHDDAGRRVAAEFGATALTSGGYGDSLPAGTPLGEAFVKRNAEVLFVEVFHKGFVLTTVTPTAVTGELIGVSTVLSKDFTTRVLKTYRVIHEGETVSKPMEV
jgi:alkaline phosphatase D